MNTLSTPLLFWPVYKDYIWGGDRIPSVYARHAAPERCAESWEIAAHPDGDSEVAQGRFAGHTLCELAARFRAALTGTRAPDPTRFPLLFKLIDAREKLSVQVHPSNATAALTGGEPKTEMWYVLDGELNLKSEIPKISNPPHPALYAGLREGVTPDTFRAALANGTAEQCLVEMPVSAGQSLFIPGGLVHAIGAGCLIYEVQQNSNTTYRLYDWGRLDTNGNPRPLHIEESFKVMDWTRQPPRMNAPAATRTTANAVWADVVSCDYFNVRKLTLSGQEVIPVDGTSFHALFAESGNAVVETEEEGVGLVPGTSCLIPAAAGRYTLFPVDGPATLLITTL